MSFIAPKGFQPMQPAQVHARAASPLIDVLPRFACANPKNPYDLLEGYNYAAILDEEKPYNLYHTLSENYDLANKKQQPTEPLPITKNTREKIYIDPNAGNDANSGKSETSAFKTFKAATKRQQDNQQLILARGRGPYSFESTQEWNANNVYITTFGVGPAPELRPTAPMTLIRFNGFGALMEDVQVAYGSLTDANRDGTVLAGGTGSCIALRRCEVKNADMLFNGEHSADNVLIQQCNSLNPWGLSGYLVWIGGEGYTVIGCNVRNSTREHPLRSSGDLNSTVAQRFCNIQHCDITNDASAGKGDESKSTGNGRWVENWYAAYNILKGGSLGFGITDSIAADRPHARCKTIMLRGNMMSEGSRIEVNNSCVDVCARENKINLLVTTKAWSTPPGFNVEVSRPKQPGIFLGRLDIINNTVINQNEATQITPTGSKTGSGGKFLEVYGSSKIKAITMKDNTMESPKSPAEMIQAGSLSMFKYIGGNVRKPAGPMALINGKKLLAMPVAEA